MAQNRTCIHLLADAAGLSYAETKRIFFNIAYETPVAPEMTERLIKRIRGL